MVDSRKDGFYYTSISANNFFINHVNNQIKYGENRSETVYDICLANCSKSDESELNSNIMHITLPDEKMALLKEKQEELGYDSFARFVKNSLLNDILSDLPPVTNLNPNSVPIQKLIVEESPKLISLYKFETLTDRCYNALLHGKYTSYDINLLRDNKTYENDISLFEFNSEVEQEDYAMDFLEYDMIFCLQRAFNDYSYSELIGESTNQFANGMFLELEDKSRLKPFIDYENIVPDTNSNYYLFIYCVFNDLGCGAIEIFGETEEHINFLLDRYTFDKIMKHYKDKHNINDYHKVFDEDCIDKLKSSNIIGE